MKKEEKRAVSDQSREGYIDFCGDFMRGNWL